MQVKKLLRAVFVSVAVGSVVAGGVYAYVKLKSNEEVYYADLFGLVPTGSDLLFYSHDAQHLPDHLPVSLLPDERCFLLARSLYSECKTDVNISGGNEMLLSFKGRDGLILYRTTPEDVNAWEKERMRKHEFLFSPQKEKYLAANISVYLTADNRFFCFTRHRGAFIGSFSKSLVREALEMYDAEETLRENESFRMALKISGKRALASCFFKRNDWLSFDISCHDGHYRFAGCLLPGYVSPDVYQFFNLPNGDHELDPKMIPETTSGLVYINARPNEINEKMDSLLMRHATGEVSLVYYTDSINNACKAICVSIEDRDAFLKDLASSPVGIYAGDSVEVFTFYGKYLLLAHSKEMLESYLQLITSGRTFDGNPLYKLYANNRHAAAGVWALLDKRRLLEHPDACRDIVPEYFLQNNGDEDFRALIRFSREEELIYYNVEVERKE
jgi:hypothetical protein